MRVVMITAVVVTMWLGLPATALAGPATGTTTLLGDPISGASVDVDVSVISEAPVVAYLYALQNECFFSGKASGKPDSYQQDPIVDWVYSDPPPYGDVPHATMTVNLLPVPAGSVCKVFIVKNNTVVKGSTTEYTVQVPPP